MLPILLETDLLVLYSYPFFMGVSWAFAYRFSSSLIQKHSANQFSPWFFIGVFLSSFLGAKLFYLYFSSQGLFNEYYQSLSFWFGGGYVFYGGLVFGSIWTYISRKTGLIDKHSIKYLLPGLAGGHAIGRLGCFLAGCCYGHLMDSGYHFPIQLVESFLLIILAVYLLKSIHKQNLVFIYFISYSIIRFIVEFERSDEVRGLFLMDLSTSQFISIIILLLVMLSMLLLRKNKTT